MRCSAPTGRSTGSRRPRAPAHCGRDARAPGSTIVAQPERLPRVDMDHAISEEAFVDDVAMPVCAAPSASVTAQIRTRGYGARGRESGRIRCRPRRAGRRSGTPSRKGSFHRDPIFLAGYGSSSAVPVVSRRTRREALWRPTWSSKLRVRPFRTCSIRRGVDIVRTRAACPAQPPRTGLRVRRSQSVPDGPVGSRRGPAAGPASLHIR